MCKTIVGRNFSASSAAWSGCRTCTGMGANWYIVSLKCRFGHSSCFEVIYGDQRARDGRVPVCDAIGLGNECGRRLEHSQPAVSRMLQQAEERLGFSLFERERKRLKPTTEAQTLFAKVVNVFAAIEHTQRLAVELRDGQAGLRALVRPDWCSETKCDRLG